MPVKSWLVDLVTPSTEKDPVAAAVAEKRSQEVRRTGWNFAGSGAPARYAKATAVGGTPTINASLGAPPPPSARKPRSV